MMVTQERSRPIRESPSEERVFIPSVKVEGSRFRHRLSLSGIHLAQDAKDLRLNFGIRKRLDPFGEVTLKIVKTPLLIVIDPLRTVTVIVL